MLSLPPARTAALLLALACSAAALSAAATPAMPTIPLATTAHVNLTVSNNPGYSLALMRRNDSALRVRSDALYYSDGKLASNVTQLNLGSWHVLFVIPHVAGKPDKCSYQVTQGGWIPLAPPKTATYNGTATVRGHAANVWKYEHALSSTSSRTFFWAFADAAPHKLLRWTVFIQYPSSERMHAALLAGIIAPAAPAAAASPSSPSSSAPPPPPPPVKTSTVTMEVLSIEQGIQGGMEALTKPAICKVKSGN
eukprot:PLAT8429.1.p1 GENE.PLAT8429.1~~PLAT8429.1.p1  ORF type:complete len:262 (-),score=85.81 PLAT8429.1:102-857(-)